jgi:hypothetical protein
VADQVAFWPFFCIESAVAMFETLNLSEGRSSPSNPPSDFPVENAVSLERLLAHKFALDWFEAVAIVLRSCEGPDGVPLSFAPAHIIVRVDGTVHVSSKVAVSSVGDQPAVVQNAAALLRELLPETFPAPLRLALTQALSTPPSYSSIREFCGALEYFERPDRTSVIQAVFQRWKTYLDQQRRLDEAVNTNTDNRERIPPPSQAEGSASRRRAIVWGIALAATISVVLLLTLWIAFGSRGVPGPVGAITKAGASVIDTGRSIARNLIDRLGSSPSTPDASAVADVPSVPAGDAPPVPSRPGRINNGSAQRRPAVGFTGASSPTTVFRAFGVLEPPLLVPHLNSAMQLGSQSFHPTSDGELEPRATQRPVSASQIYSPTDTDVVPPVAVYPHLPASAFVAQDDALMFDVVIDHAGNVESVKSLRPANTMGSALRLTMSLSAAKSWRFQPAIKDGQGVRYRHTIWIPFP